MFKIELSDADIELIGSLLDEQPFKRVHALAKHIQAQIDAQLAERSQTAAVQQQAAIDQIVNAEIEKRGASKPKRKSKG